MANWKKILYTFRPTLLYSFVCYVRVRTSVRTFPYCPIRDPFLCFFFLSVYFFFSASTHVSSNQRFSVFIKNCISHKHRVFMSRKFFERAPKAISFNFRNKPIFLHLFCNKFKFEILNAQHGIYDSNAQKKTSLYTTWRNLFSFTVQTCNLYIAWINVNILTI